MGPGPVSYTLYLVPEGRHASEVLLAAVQALQEGPQDPISLPTLSTEGGRVVQDRPRPLVPARLQPDAALPFTRCPDVQGLGFWQSAWLTSHKLIIGVTLAVRYMPHKLAPSIFPRECKSA